MQLLLGNFLVLFVEDELDSVIGVEFHCSFGIPEVLYCIYLAVPLLFAPPLASPAAAAASPPPLWPRIGTARRCSPTAHSTVGVTVVVHVTAGL
ncbi:unnamed protein product [Ilex paraguariensis]|uniref:Secreted protein n=1 Tax=Ilex paraguariensis TaxID=185542 RepID=A0ABC8RAS4_9AQUA